MKLKLALLASAIALIATAASAQVSLEKVRGRLSPQLLAQGAGPLKVAVCPGSYTAVFENRRLSCKLDIEQTDDVKCPSNFPNFTARNARVGTDSDLCAKAGVNITSDGSLANLTKNIDYVFIPVNGVRNGVSFLAHHPEAQAADGWAADLSNSGASGITDRYKRIVTNKASPNLVNP